MSIQSAYFIVTKTGLLGQVVKQFASCASASFLLCLKSLFICHDDLYDSTGYEDKYISKLIFDDV